MLFVARPGLEPGTPTLKVWCSKNHWASGPNGGSGRSRTYLAERRQIYSLRHSPWCNAPDLFLWSRPGLNRWPPDYESDALTNWATGPGIKNNEIKGAARRFFYITIKINLKYKKSNYKSRDTNQKEMLVSSYPFILQFILRYALSVYLYSIFIF